jgi:hypothetical protein
MATSGTTGVRSTGVLSSGAVKVRLFLSRNTLSSLPSDKAVTALRSGSVMKRVRSGTQLKIMPVRVMRARLASAADGSLIGVIVLAGARPSTAFGVRLHERTIPVGTTKTLRCFVRRMPRTMGWRVNAGRRTRSAAAEDVAREDAAAQFAGRTGEWHAAWIDDRFETDALRALRRACKPEAAESVVDRNAERIAHRRLRCRGCIGRGDRIEERSALRGEQLNEAVVGARLTARAAEARRDHDRRAIGIDRQD